MRKYEEYRENKAHGDAVFPFNIYPCRIPDMFTEVLTHWHDEMEIIYVKEGSGIITVDLESRICHAPCLVFALPGNTHAIRRLEGETMVYENILFHPRLLYSMSGEVFDREYLGPLFRGQIRIPSFLTPESGNFQEMLETIRPLNGERRQEEAYPLFAKSCLFRLCYLLTRDYPMEEESPIRREKLERLKTVLAYVEEHYAEDIRVAEAAALVGFSESHFMRSFKEIMGVSFVSYLKDYRLYRAEALLRNSRISILGVAGETGFHNFSYFIRNFKERYGTTPLKYREEWERKTGQ